MFLVDLPSNKDVASENVTYCISLEVGLWGQSPP